MFFFPLRLVLAESFVLLSRYESVMLLERLLHHDCSSESQVLMNIH